MSISICSHKNKKIYIFTLNKNKNNQIKKTHPKKNQSDSLSFERANTTTMENDSTEGNDTLPEVEPVARKVLPPPVHDASYRIRVEQPC